MRETVRLLIRPIADPVHEIDVTTAVLGAIAGELSRRYGGNDALNWLEAERHLCDLIEAGGRVRRNDRVPLVVTGRRSATEPGARARSTRMGRETPRTGRNAERTRSPGLQDEATDERDVR